MISSVLSHDIIITSSYRDLLGLVSYLPINIWSNKINCGIKTVLYNKIGDNFFLFYINNNLINILSFINISCKIRINQPLFIFIIIIIIGSDAIK